MTKTQMDPEANIGVAEVALKPLLERSSATVMDESVEQGMVTAGTRYDTVMVTRAHRPNAVAKVGSPMTARSSCRPNAVSVSIALVRLAAVALTWSAAST